MDNANRMTENGRLDIVVSIDIDASNQVDERPVLRPEMRALSVDGLIYKMVGHGNCLAFEMRVNPIS
ncbi:hypothetical protein [Allosphingosinicella sp.]|uniref:hypothetical protein n=1 Tax=Allosphingosinicella sp. TaxID=2823234 RepID=UPI002FC230FD